jgi:proline iminopeptidase
MRTPIRRFPRQLLVMSGACLLGAGQAGGAEVREFALSGEEADLLVRVAAPEQSRRTLVTVHGGPGKSHEYLAVMERLTERGVTVVSYDQRGVGRSSGPAEASGYDLDAYVEDLERVRVGLGQDRIDLLGHSWGGIVAMAYKGGKGD